MIRQFTAIPLAILSDARSWLGYFGKRPPEKEWLWADHWGWTGPGMAEHWDRYFRNPGDKEARKNLITEWARLSPERAGKVASLLIVTAFLGWPVCLLVGLLIG
jgi:hypothetical protein